MKRFTVLLIVALFAMVACGQEEPPVEPITYDRYDHQSVPMGTATIWTCSTSAQFDYAIENHSAGDQIVLANSDTVFTASVTGSYNGHPISIDVAGFYGDETNQSKYRIYNERGGAWGGLQFDYSGGQVFVRNLIQQEKNWFWGTADTEFDNVNVGEMSGNESSSISFNFNNYQDAPKLILKNISGDTVWLYGSPDTVIIENIQLTGMSDACDFDEMNGSDLNVINTWKYGGDRYSFFHLALQDPAVTEAAALKSCPAGSPTDFDLYVRFSVPHSHTEDNENLIDVDVEYGSSASYGSAAHACYSSSESEWQAELDVTSIGKGSTVYWRVKSAMCDSTYYSTGQTYLIPNKGPYVCAAPSWWDCD